jgi:hypothetical protein
LPVLSFKSVIKIEAEVKVAFSFVAAIMLAFEVFADSNVARNWKAVASESGRLTGSALRQTTTLISLRDSLKTVAQSTRFIIIAALSNPISRLKFEGVHSLKPTLQGCIDEMYDYILQTANNNPDLKVITVSFLTSVGLLMPAL